jgi:hypothetical protein
MAAFTRARHSCLSWGRSIQSTRGYFPVLGSLLQAARPPIFGYLWHIQRIRSYPPYLEAVFSSVSRGRASPWWQGPSYHG